MSVSFLPRSVYLIVPSECASLEDSPSGQKQHTPPCSLTFPGLLLKGHLEGQSAVSLSYPAGLEGESDPSSAGLAGQRRAGTPLPSRKSVSSFLAHPTL